MCDLNLSSPLSPTGVIQVLLHMEVTPNIDLDFMKYNGSLMFGSAHMISVGRKAFPCNVMQTEKSDRAHF